MKSSLLLQGYTTPPLIPEPASHNPLDNERLMSERSNQWGFQLTSMLNCHLKLGIRVLLFHHGVFFVAVLHLDHVVVDAMGRVVEL